MHKLDKAGADFWLYRLDGHQPLRQARQELPPQPRVERADPATLHRVYRALLAGLPLVPRHRQALRRRGLSDREIVRRGYRTFPLYGRATRARQIVEQCGPHVCAQVPGFYIAERHGQSWWSLAGAAGLLIPVRDREGLIVALKVRADEPGDGPKYTTISSAKHGGPSPGAQVHVPLYEGTHGDTVRLTEGELKADVTTALSGLLTIAIPGVALWRKALPVLQVLQATRVLLALDGDWRTNAHVAQALGHAAFTLVKAGYEVRVEIWKVELGKGIDDLFAAGHTPMQHASAMAFTCALREQARVWSGPRCPIAAQEGASCQ